MAAILQNLLAKLYEVENNFSTESAIEFTLEHVEIPIFAVSIYLVVGRKAEGGEVLFCFVWDR